MYQRLGLAALAFGLMAACGSSGPTGSSDLDLPKSTGSTLAAYSLAEPDPLAAGEDFSCRNVAEVRARFDDPGFVRDDTVGFYVFFSGVPEGPKRLRIWWDYLGDRTAFEDHRFAETETVIEQVYEHHYPSVSGTEEFLVRVELILDGLTGNCARNRAVVVVKESPTGGAPTPAPTPTTQTANVGPPVSAVTGPGFGSEGVKFTVLSSLTIDSVEVDVNTAGVLTIDVVDAGTSAVLDSTSISVGTGVQRIALGFNVPPGTYILCNAGTATLGATLSIGGVTYPFTVPGVVSLIDSAFGLGSFFGYYYYFYDWQITW